MVSLLREVEVVRGGDLSRYTMFESTEIIV